MKSHQLFSQTGINFFWGRRCIACMAQPISNVKFHNAFIQRSPATFVISPARSHPVVAQMIAQLKAQVSQGPLQSLRILADSLLVSLADQRLPRLRAQTVYSSDCMANINKPRKPHSHWQECLTHIVWIFHSSPKSPSCISHRLSASFRLWTAGVVNI